MGFVDWLFGAAPETAVEERSLSISDPALAEYFAAQGIEIGAVTDQSALSITAYWRAVSLISGTIAGLPLKTYRTKADGTRERVASFLDRPAGPYELTPFAWKELVLVHLLTRGETFLMHIRNQGGALVGLYPVHPSAVEDVKLVGTDKRFVVRMADGTKQTFDRSEMTHVMGLTLDGIRGESPLSVHRQTIRLGLAGDKAAERSMTKGALIAGLVTPESDLTEDEAKAIKAGLDKKIAGADHAGEIAVVNRALKFNPWTMTNADAQFLESRQFQVEEIARVFGVPPHLLAQTEKQTSWGSGVAEQNVGLARYTFKPWTDRIEETLSALLPNPRFAEFDYAGLLQGSPREEIELLIKQVEAGLLTKDEARAIRNLPPVKEQDKDEAESPAEEGE